MDLNSKYNVSERQKNVVKPNKSVQHFMRIKSCGKYKTAFNSTKEIFDNIKLIQDKFNWTKSETINQLLKIGIGTLEEMEI